MTFLVGTLVICAGTLLAVYGSTFYPLRHEYSNYEDFARARRRARSYQYVGAAMALLAWAAVLFI